MIRWLISAYTLVATPAVADVEKLPILLIDEQTYAIYETATKTGKFGPFVATLSGRVKEIYDTIQKDDESDGKIVATAGSVAGVTVMITTKVCEDGVSATGTFAGGPCAVTALGSLLINALAQPLIFSEMEGHTVIFIANGDSNDIEWHRHIEIESGSLTHKPASHVIPGRTADGVSVGMFVFEKNFGLNGEFAVIRFHDAAYPGFLIGAAAPYHDQALIRNKSKAACHFTNSGRMGQKHLYDSVLNSDKSRGILGDTNTAINRDFSRMARIACRLDSVDKWANTMLVNLSSVYEPNVRHGSLFAQLDGKGCALVPHRAQAPLDFEQSQFPTRFDCSVDTNHKATMVVQVADRFWGRVGPRICAFGALGPNAPTPSEALVTDSQVVAGYDCSVEPDPLDVLIVDGSLRLKTEIGGKPCALTGGGGVAVFDCEDLAGVPIIPQGF